MAGPKKPIKLNLAIGTKHWSKEEIAERLESEVQPCTDGIAAPAYLTEKQKEQFDIIADQLQRIEILGETDNDALGRYIVAQTFYEEAVEEMRQLHDERPESPEADASPEERDRFYNQMSVWSVLSESAAKQQDRFFKQAQTAANALGLTITSRCKLVVPKSAEPPKINKFDRFGTVANDE